MLNLINSLGISIAQKHISLLNNLEDIGNYANDIVSDSEYNDAGTLRDTAIDCISKIEDILEPTPEEETEETE